jgi:hypothetical protein
MAQEDERSVRKRQQRSEREKQRGGSITGW